MRDLQFSVQRASQHATARGTARRATIPAPVGGWNVLDSESDMDPRYAIELVNFFPERGRVIGRPGCTEYVDIPGETGEIGTLASHRAGTTNAFYAFSPTKLWDISDPDDVAEVTTATVTGNRWHYAHTLNHLIAVNGRDVPLRIEKGATARNVAHGFTTDPDVNLDPRDLNYIAIHHNRLFFGETDSPRLWYGALGASTGALESIDLGLVVSDGGNIRALGSFTLDSGSGVDDLLGVFMQSGKVLLYSGTDPGDADNWRIAGIFNIGQTVGQNPVVKRGGDLIAITVDGYVPLLPFLHAERSDQRIAISDKIAPAVHDVVELYADEPGWQAVMHAPANVLLFNVPLGGDVYEQHVSNLQTGAWARFTGWNAACWGQHDDRLYFGTADGKVIRAFHGGTDCGAAVPSRIRSAYNYLGSPYNKHINLIRAHTESAGGTTPIAVGISADFDRDLPVAAPATLEQGGTAWDTAKWDTFTWGAGISRHRAWRSAPGNGVAFSLHIAATTEGDPVSYFGGEIHYDQLTDIGLAL